MFIPGPGLEIKADFEISSAERWEGAHACAASLNASCEQSVGDATGSRSKYMIYPTYIAMRIL